MKTIVIAGPNLRLKSELKMWAGGLVFAQLLVLLAAYGQIDLACTILIAGTLVLATLFDRALGALLTLGYLIVMGDIRRLVSYVSEPRPFDLLLMIAPAIAAMIAVPLLIGVRLKDHLSRAMLLLLIIMLLEVFNPQQGGLEIGLSGALFYVAPMFWFWIGRRYASPTVVKRLLYSVIAPLAILAALLGLIQTFIGFLPWEQAWIDRVQSTYTAIHLAGSVRAFGFSVSGAEYAILMMIAAAAIICASFTGKKVWASALPILGIGILLASSRGVALRLMIAVAAAWTLRTTPKLYPAILIRLAVVGSVALFGIIGLASWFAPSYSERPGNQTAVQNALAHETGGLAHPLDEHYSTAGIHERLVLSGFEEGFADPIGHGLGATTLAALKFGGDPNEGSSEIDVSDMFVSLGLIGGLVYLSVLCLVARRALCYLQAVPRSIGLTVFVILLCTAGSWLIGGQYSISSILFFLIGGLEYQFPEAVIVRKSFA
jgi:hypothetical protein